MQHRFKHQDRHLDVSLKRIAEGHYEATIDDRSHEVRVSVIDQATLHIVWEGRARVVHAARVGAGYQVAIDGAVYVLSPDAGGSTAANPTLASPQIAAPMPGKVLQVLVCEGQEVAAGDGLVILEAMKMENRIAAEAPAVVRKVHVADGQMVDGGQVLIELEYA